MTIRLPLLTLLAFPIISSNVTLANGPPINSETAFTTGLNGAAIRSFAKLTHKSGSTGKVDIVSTPFIVPYELLSNQLIMGAGIPFLDKTMTAVDGTQRSSGYGHGDLFIFGKYNLYQKDEHQETFRVAGKVSVSFPTGRDDLEDAQGRLPRSLQRGTGSVNPSALLIATKIWKRIGINGDMGYTFFSETGGFDRGDEIRFDLAGSYRLMPTVFGAYPDHQLNLMFELNGNYAEKSKSSGVYDPDSGGTLIYASPGVQYMYSNLIIEMSVQLPALRSFNGTQLEPDYTVLLGVRWFIF